MTDNASGLLIALSAGGRNDELAAQGVGIEHVEELMVRIAMKLLRDGHRLAFGGTLGNPDQPLTRYLIDTAQNWLNEDSAKHIDVNEPQTWPLLNCSSWPYYTSITEEQKARLVGICQFENIDPPAIVKSELKPLVEEWATKSRARRFAADALSAMREKSARDTALRIVWGGRIAGAAGWMAGILEEVGYSLEHDKPVLICGGFGGCAGLLATFLAHKNAPWPDKLSLAASADAERDCLLEDAEKKSLTARFTNIQSRLTEFRKAIHKKPTANGISSEQIQRALSDESARSVINIAAAVAEDLRVALRQK